VKRIEVRKDLVITGGGAKNNALVREIESNLGMESLRPPEPLLSGAIGAALAGKAKVELTLKKGLTLPMKKRELKEAHLFD